MAVTNSVLVNDGGAPARIVNFTAAEDITAGRALEINASGQVKMADTVDEMVAGFSLVDASSGDLCSCITGSGIILNVHLDGDNDIAIGDMLELATAGNGCLITSSAESDASSLAICLEACTDTAAQNVTNGALYKVLVK
jgi:hypothetical protein|tara:strand:- start:261 stop:680 length:420 start_codon:yes stop_codon:yes gene_type:complete